MTDPVPIIEMRNIKKHFGAVQALRGVDLALRHNEVLGLVGDNAAGKSTLMKVLSGAYIPDEGEIFLASQKVIIMDEPTARLGVAAPTAATGYELDIIAAAVIGGVSLFGGEDTILGVLIGAALMQTIRTGLNLLGFPTYWQPAAIGAVIIIAIMFDQWRKRAR